MFRRALRVAVQEIAAVNVVLELLWRVSICLKYTNVTRENPHRVLNLANTII